MRIEPPTTLALSSFLVAVVGAAGCATEQPASAGFAPSFSTPSDSFQTSYASRGPSMVSRVNVDADLVVRPDRICVPIQITAAADDNAQAMALVEQAVARVKGAVGDATLRVDDIDARSDRTESGTRSTVSMRGVVETELPDTDAWTRAKKVGALDRAVAEQATWETGKAEDPKNPVAHVIVGSPEPGVRDIEVHRPKLLASWAERAKALATAASSDVALELVNCAPPGQVVVVGGTLEKVGLTLPVQCTFAVKTAVHP